MQRNSSGAGLRESEEDASELYGKRMGRRVAAKPRHSSTFSLPRRMSRHSTENTADLGELSKSQGRNASARSALAFHRVLSRAMDVFALSKSGSRDGVKVPPQKVHPDKWRDENQSTLPASAHETHRLREDNLKRGVYPVSTSTSPSRQSQGNVSGRDNSTNGLVSRQGSSCSSIDDTAESSNHVDGRNDHNGTAGGATTRVRVLKKKVSSRLLARGSSTGSVPPDVVHENQQDGDMSSPGGDVPSGERIQARTHKVVRRRYSRKSIGSKKRTSSRSSLGADSIASSAANSTQSAESHPPTQTESDSSQTTNRSGPGPPCVLQQRSSSLSAARGGGCNDTNGQNPRALNTSPSFTAPPSDVNGAKPSVVRVLPPIHTVNAAYKLHKEGQNLENEEEKISDESPFPIPLPPQPLAIDHDSPTAAVDATTGENDHEKSAEDVYGVIDDVELETKIANGEILRDRRRSTVELEKCM